LIFAHPHTKKTFRKEAFFVDVHKNRLSDYNKVTRSPPSSPSALFSAKNFSIDLALDKMF